MSGGGPRSARRVTLKVGLEIHVELATETKMFTRSVNVAHPSRYDAEPNTLVDPYVAGMPGTLPVANRRAIEMAMKVGLALGCRIAEVTKWDRKSYFYPDLPKGYQISQYDMPLCVDGAVDLPLADEPRGAAKRIRIVRAHLEEDAGKLGHELPGGARFEGSLVDLNRAGTPLLEIVTHPDFSEIDEVVRFAQWLRQVCRFLRVTEGIMQKGHMRFEPNINLLIDDDGGTTHATPIVEIKNLNSFRSLRGAIEYEMRRQREEWLATGETAADGSKTTRGWDDIEEVTRLQRSKEDAPDYRYFPDPDLVPVTIDAAWRESIEAALPEPPYQRMVRFVRDLHLALDEAHRLTDDPDTCEYFETCVAAVERSGAGLNGPSAARAVANVLLQHGLRLANERRRGMSELGVTPEQVAGIVELRESNRIGSSAVGELFARLGESNKSAEQVAEEHRLLQVGDAASLEAWVDAAIAANPKAVEDLRQGKLKAQGAIIGHVMKQSRGQADASAVAKLLRERLGLQR